MEVSNNLLAVLVIIAMAMSITGTMSVISNMPGRPAMSITGMGTTEQEATANVTLAQEVSISLLISAVEFGPLGLGASNATQGLVGGAIQLQPLVLRNVGTTEANVSMAFWNGTDNFTDDVTHSPGHKALWWSSPNSSYFFQYNGTKNSSLATYITLCCSAGDFLNNVPINESDGWISTDPANLVYNLSEADLENTINIELNITAPVGEPAGRKGTTLRFKAGSG